MKAASRLTCAFLFAMGLAGSGRPALADITIVKPIVNNTSRYQFVANWEFELDVQENDRIGQLNGPWLVIVDSPQSPDGINKSLTLNYEHIRAPHGEARTGALREVDMGSFARPAVGTVRKGKAVQFTHEKHFDIIRVLAQVPALGNGAITTTGDHTIRQLSTWSALGLDGDIKVKAKTNTGREYTPQNGNAQKVRPRDHVGGFLDRQADGLFLSPDERPAEYTVFAAVGGAALPADPLSVTSLSFLGEVDGMPAQLDFAAAALAFGFLDEAFLAPVLVDANNLMDMYVAIDLTQFLFFGPTLMESDLFKSFAFSGDGTSQELPGILASTTPIMFNEMTGQYETQTPFAGELMIAGFIDGRAAIPEPSSLIVWFSGAVGLFWLRKRRPLAAAA